MIKVLKMLYSVLIFLVWLIYYCIYNFNFKINYQLIFKSNVNVNDLSFSKNKKEVKNLN